MKMSALIKGLIAALTITVFSSTAVLAAPGDNVAKGKKVTADSVYTEKEAAEFAVDGDHGVKWCSKDAPQPHYLIVELGQEYTIDKYMLVNANAATAPSAPEGAHMNTKAWEVFVSMDGTTWTSVDKVEDNTEDKPVRTITPVQAKFVKLQVDKANPVDPYVRLYEFEVYEAAATTEAPAETEKDEAAANPTTGDVGIIMYAAIALASGTVVSRKAFRK